MPRGGKRPGAGRRRGRLLSFWARFAIGGRCEKLWRHLQRRGVDAKIASSSRAYLEEIAKIRAIPISSRRPTAINIELIRALWSVFSASTRNW